MYYHINLFFLRVSLLNISFYVNQIFLDHLSAPVFVIYEGMSVLEGSANAGLSSTSPKTEEGKRRVTLTLINARAVLKARRKGRELPHPDT